MIIKHISKILTIIGLLAWVHCILNSHLDLADYGLLSTLPLSFYLSLICLSIGSFLLWSSSEKPPILLFFSQIIIFICVLYLTPFIIEKTPRLYISYVIYGFTDYILNNGGLNPEAAWYHNWPSFSIFFSVLIQVLGNNEYHKVILGIFPTLIQISYIIPLYILFKFIFNKIDGKFFAAAWIFSLANWTDQNYFSPQALSLLIIIFMVYVTFKIIKYNQNKAPFLVILISFYLLITTTHLLSSITSIMLITGLFILWKQKNIYFIILLTTILITWTIYGSALMFDLQLPKFVNEAFNFDILLQYYSNTYGLPTRLPSELLIQRIRILFMLIFTLLAIIGFIFPKNENRLSLMNLSFILIGGISFILLPILAYGSELVVRLFIFSILPLSFFGSKLLNTKFYSIVLAFSLLVCIPLHVISHYGPEKTAYIQQSVLNQANFIYKYGETGTLISQPPVGGYKDIDKYKFIMLGPSASEKNQLSRNIIERVLKSDDAETTLYVCTNTNINYSLLHMIGISDIFATEKWLSSLSDFNYIYSSHSCKTYLLKY